MRLFRTTRQMKSKTCFFRSPIAIYTALLSIIASPHHLRGLLHDHLREKWVGNAYSRHILLNWQTNIKQRTFLSTIASPTISNVCFITTGRKIGFQMPTGDVAFRSLAVIFPPCFSYIALPNTFPVFMTSGKKYWIRNAQSSRCFHNLDKNKQCF